MLIEAMEHGKADWKPAPMPKTMKEIHAEYEKQSSAIVAKFNKMPESQWNGQIEFFGNKRPSSAMAWSFLFDIVHHRGQITT